MKIGPFALLFLIVSFNRCVLLPIIVAYRKRRMPDLNPNPPIPIKQYLAIIANAVLLGSIALLTAFPEQIPVFGSFHADLKVIALAAAFLFINFAWARYEWTITPIEKKLRSGHFLPRTSVERATWVCTSFIVAIEEEIFFRGVLFLILLRITDNYWLASLISAISFAAIHLSYGWLASVILVVPAIGLQWLVRISGGLYPAIAVHFIYNAVNGIVYGAKDLSEAAKQQNLHVAQIQPPNSIENSVEG